LNVTNISEDTQKTCQDTHIAQLKRIINQMQNEIAQLKRNDDQIPRKEYQNPPFPTHGLINYLERNKNINDQAPRSRPPRVQNPNVVILKEDFDQIPEEENQRLVFQEYNNETATGC
jgi:hypothetical protein